MKERLRIFALILNIVFLFGISSLSMAWADQALHVIVSIVPQEYFIKKIGGDLVDVSVMVLPGSSPATYEPRPQQMVELTRSRIYFAIGVPFEGVWLKKFGSINSKMMIVHTEDGIEKIPMNTHHHHDEDEHYHGIKDPHVWLSPPLVMIQARNILDALLKADPAHSEVFKARYKIFIRELVDIDLKIRDVFAGKGEGIQFMVYHPAWAYFAKAYDLKQIPIETEGKEPTPKELQYLIHHARKNGVKAIFAQPQFSVKNAGTIAKSIGGRVIFANPLELNWAENLLEVAKSFKAALK